MIRGTAAFDKKMQKIEYLALQQQHLKNSYKHSPRALPSPIITSSTTSTSSFIVTKNMVRNQGGKARLCGGCPFTRVKVLIET